MRSRRPSAEHQEAVSRRLALLGAELDAVRPDPTADGVEWWAAHTRVPSDRPRLSVVDDRPAQDAWQEEAHDDPPGPPGAAHGEAPLVPVPGRHAARRSTRVLAASVPETLRGRIALGPGQVAVVAVLVALGLAVTCWWVVRGDADPVPAAVAASTAGALVAMPGSPQTGAATPVVDPGAAAVPTGSVGSAGSGGVAGGVASTVTVDVAGKVRRPGIAVLEPGSRVVDALEAAGGPRQGVDLSTLNLARILVDGEQIVVGQAAVAGAAAAATATPAAGAAGVAMVNLNTATEADLDTLPGVGPVTAQSILAWRDEHGGYSSVDELLEVSGIGDATLEKLAPYVTV